MQCQESNKVLDAYVDNELDLMQSTAVEEHLAGCPQCARKIADRRGIRVAIQNADLRAAAPPELVKGVRKALRLSEAKTPSERWLWFKNVALGFAAATALYLLIAGVIGLWFRVPEATKLVQAATDNYVRSLVMEKRGIDVASSDRHQVKPWFAGKVPFSPEVASFDDKGFPLAGGRVDYLNNQPVATLIYTRNQHVIDVFMYPESSDTQRGERQERGRGYNVVYWDKDGMQYWAVSDLNLTELKQLAALMGD